MGEYEIQTDGNCIADDNALDAVQVIVTVEIAPEPVIGPEEQKGCKATNNACREERKQVRAADTRCINRNREVGEQPRHHDNECIRKRKQALAESEICKQAPKFFHISKPTLLKIGF